MEGIVLSVLFFIPAIAVLTAVLARPKPVFVLDDTDSDAVATDLLIVDEAFGTSSEKALITFPVSIPISAILSIKAWNAALAVAPDDSCC